MRQKILITIILLLGFILNSSIVVSAQELIKPRLSMSYFKNADDLRSIKIRVSARIERKTEMIEGIEVGIYHTESSDDNLLGYIETDEDGSGSLLFPESFKNVADTTNEYLFIGIIENQPGYSDVEKEINVSEASLKIEFLIEDSIKIVDATLFQPDNEDNEDNEGMLEDIEIKVLVKRPFGDLPIHKESLFSDEEGNVKVAFPDDLPADSLKSLEVIVRVEDNDTYGNLETTSRIDWGIPRKYDDKTLQRSLWAAGANAPLWLMFFTNSLIAVVWGIIFYIIYQIYIIYKIR